MKTFIKSNRLDTWILSAFVVLITFHPYFLYGKINIYEVGLYLPGINGVLHGLVPYRDFFHLRGPFELYMPAGMMAVLGPQLSVLSLYFYIGTVLTLIVCVLIAKELYCTRLVLYVMVPVLVARTFPRVVFTYWGGMRYVFGLLAVWCAVKFIKQERVYWLFWAGVASACGLFTSVEIGVCAVGGILSALIFAAIFKLLSRRLVVRSATAYCLGLSLICGSYAAYLAATQSLIPFIESVYTVVTSMEKTLNPHLVSEYPSNFFEAFRAMVNPAAKNFRHMTPSYLYILLLGYLIYRCQTKRLAKTDLSLFCIGVYGLIMYNAAFRSIWAAQFEMALQPEKILFFFLLEETYLALRNKRDAISLALRSFKSAIDRRSGDIKIYAIHTLIFLFIASSLGYSIDRYNKRFFAVKFLRYKLTGGDINEIIPLKEFAKRPVNIARANGMVAPLDQAQELEAIVGFFEKNTSPDNIVFTYPELGTYNFLIDRPFVGRFPMATFSWFNDRWHEELMNDLRTVKPKYLILQNDFPPNWKEVYLGREENRQKYKEAMDFIASEYTLKTKTPLSLIYIRKQGG